jgi:hypothetical protein
MRGCLRLGLRHGLAGFALVRSYAAIVAGWSVGLAALPKDVTELATGTVKFFNAEKDYGFISRGEGDDADPGTPKTRPAVRESGTRIRNSPLRAGTLCDRRRAQRATP